MKALVERLQLLEARAPHKEKGLVHYMRRRESGDVHVRFPKKWEFMSFVEKLKHLLKDIFKGKSFQMVIGKNMYKISYDQLWNDFSMLDKLADFWFSNTIMKIKSTKGDVDSTYQMFQEGKKEWSEERMIPILRIMLTCVVLYEIYGNILYVKAAVWYERFKYFQEYLPGEFSMQRLERDTVRFFLYACMIYKCCVDKREKHMWVSIVKDKFRAAMGLDANEDIDEWARVAMSREFRTSL